uniref:Uncharacterized protein n=1 Tax=Acrobeloides nanus TaxID=290746 RepID=A0A914DBE0_9BILA
MAHIMRYTKKTTERNIEALGYHGFGVRTAIQCNFDNLRKNYWEIGRRDYMGINLARNMDQTWVVQGAGDIESTYNEAAKNQDKATLNILLADRARIVNESNATLYHTLTSRTNKLIE